MLTDGGLLAARCQVAKCPGLALSHSHLCIGGEFRSRAKGTASRTLTTSDVCEVGDKRQDATLELVLCNCRKWSKWVPTARDVAVRIQSVVLCRRATISNVNNNICIIIN